VNHSDSNQDRRNVVLLGIGHTNAHIVKEWAANPIRDCNLVCISNYPTATYSGMLPGTLGWQFKDDQMRIDLASLAARSGAKLVIADANGLDLNSGRVLFSDREPIAFDALSIGVGSMPAGWQQHSESPLLIPVKPMQTFLQRLSDRLAACLTKSNVSPSVVDLVKDPDSESVNKIHDENALAPVQARKVAIVGGGVASVEIAFCLLLQFQKQEIGREVSIEIFTSAETVAEGMAPRSIRSLQRRLRSRGIKIIPGKQVIALDEHGLVTKDGVHHAADAVIWATGAAAPPVLSKLGLQTDQRGFVATSRTLQSLSDRRIFAVGDAGTIVDSPSPKAGVYAVRQCPVLWHNLRAFLNDGELQNFEPQADFLKILNTGDGKAFLQYGWFTAHARWCWKLKTWIDRRFIEEFQ
jgi:NADH dehydrogenase FAD-containing subunit